MKSDLSKVKVGDKIWTIQYGWQEVICTGNDGNYPIRVLNNNGYTIDGKCYVTDKYPSAFLEYPFKEQLIEKDTIVWFRDDEEGTWLMGYYSHFKDEKHFCFAGSRKSTETNISCSWKIVTTENPLL